MSFLPNRLVQVKNLKTKLNSTTQFKLVDIKA